MIYNIPELVNDCHATLAMIEQAIKKAKDEAEILGCDVYDLRTGDGRWVMNELISAKVQATYSLLMIELLDPDTPIK